MGRPAFLRILAAGLQGVHQSPLQGTDSVLPPEEPKTPSVEPQSSQELCLVPSPEDRSVMGRPAFLRILAACLQGVHQSPLQGTDCPGAREG